MSVDKLVDSSQLNADLTTVANAIRTKGGTSAQLSFPSGMAQAIAAIPSGIIPSGSQTFTTNGTYDVTSLAQAIVNVAGSDRILYSGSITPASDGSLIATGFTVFNFSKSSNAYIGMMWADNSVFDKIDQSSLSVYYFVRALFYYPPINVSMPTKGKTYKASSFFTLIRPNTYFALTSTPFEQATPNSYSCNGGSPGGCFGGVTYHAVFVDISG